MPPRYRTEVTFVQDANTFLRNFDAPDYLTTAQERVVGRGLMNPFAFNIESKSVDIIRQTYGLQKINCSIRDILNTLCYDPVTDTGGERYKNPEYGSGLKRMIHEPVDPATGVWETEARGYIKIAIDKWEKRIQLTEMDFFYNFLANHIVYIKLYYQVLSTSQAGSYVHPFVLGSYPTP